MIRKIRLSSLSIFEFVMFYLLKFLRLDDTWGECGHVSKHPADSEFHTHWALDWRYGLSSEARNTYYFCTIIWRQARRSPEVCDAATEYIQTAPVTPSSNIKSRPSVPRSMIAKYHLETDLGEQLWQGLQAQNPPFPLCSHEKFPIEVGWYIIRHGIKGTDSSERNASQGPRILHSIVADNPLAISQMLMVPFTNGSSQNV